MDNNKRQQINNQFRRIKAKSLRDILESKDSELEYLIDDFIHEKTINLISGQAGVGKSMLTQVIAGNLSCGDMIFDRFSAKKCNVAFLDRENEENMIKDRFTKIKSNPDNIFYLSLDLIPMKEACAEIESFLTCCSIDVLIIDTLRRFQDGDENDSYDTNNFFLVLKKLLRNIKAIFLIHHLKKNLPGQKSNNESARGSTDIIASVDTHFLLEEVKDTDFLVLRNVKNRGAKKIHDLSFKIIGDEEIIRLEFQDNYSELFESKRKKTKRLIIEALNELGEANFDQIAQRVKDGGGYSENKVRKFLLEFKEKNAILIRKNSNKLMYSVNPKNQEIQYTLNPPQLSIH